MPVFADGDKPIGKAVEALVECGSGTISYIVVASGGLGGIDEQLRAIPRDLVAFACDKLVVSMTEEDFTGLTPLEAGDWPAQATALPVAAR
jgi:hypothetical protein